LIVALLVLACIVLAAIPTSAESEVSSERHARALDVEDPYSKSKPKNSKPKSAKTPKTPKQHPKTPKTPKASPPKRNNTHVPIVHPKPVNPKRIVKPVGPVPVHASQGSCFGGQGVCQDSNQMDCDGGNYITGQCPGAASIQCCVPTPQNTGGSGSWSGLGVDVSDLCSASNFACLKQSGYNFAVVRAWRSSGTWDPQCSANIDNAISAGMSPVDVYMFPRPLGASGSSQASALLSNLQNTNFNGTIWFDVEQESPYWSTQSANQQFFNAVISTLQAAGASVGIYTSKSQWTAVMGSSFSGGANLPLWYSHYDNVQGFSDWSSSAIGRYGGWSAPTIKQYMGDKSACNCNTDFNYAP